MVLINELDFSGGDFFPAIMQDNKRAVILGTRTAGAGGYVLQYQFPNLSGIYLFSLTGSLAERDGGDMIENLGVTPDVGYELTPDDLEFGYQGYKSKIVSTMEEMLKGK
jgi:C-terminal processing protease CtpA/Prc